MTGVAIVATDEYDRISYTLSGRVNFPATIAMMDHVKAILSETWIGSMSDFEGTDVFEVVRHDSPEQIAFVAAELEDEKENK